jgi:hypothetical protein
MPQNTPIETLTVPRKPGPTNRLESSTDARKAEIISALEASARCLNPKEVEPESAA